MSFGVLALLERLTPPERAAFVLREAFNYSHREIAEILDVNEAHARQLYRRAHAHIGEPRRRFTASLEHKKKLVERFLAATVDGDVAGLERLLAEDVVSWADGGGKAMASRRPLFGRASLVRLFVGLSRHPRATRAELSVELVNTDPAIVVREDGVFSNIVVPEVSDGQIVVLHTIANPDKLIFAARQRM